MPQVFDETVFASLPRTTVLCVGDVMLDRFVYGAVDRISPEAPIPVIRVENEKHMLGGAGNVVANITALGAQAVLVAVTGKDSASAELRQQLDAARVKAVLIEDATRTTTIKSRFVSGQQQVLRVDREDNTAINDDTAEKLLTAVKEQIKTARAVILSDYGKGVLTPTVIQDVIALATQAKIPVIVDPKGDDFSKYRGAQVITPNRKELETASRHTAGNDAEVRAAAMSVITKCGVDTILATRGKDGMSLIQKNAEPLHIVANVREVFDVSGAGDTVIATFATLLAADTSVETAAEIANIAAGIVVGKRGTATVSVDEIRAVATRHKQAHVTTTYKSKVVNLQQAEEIAVAARAGGLRIGFTNGCFDLLHPGHLSSIRQAKEACDVLFVGVNSDASIKTLKGPTRPVQDQNARAEILAALGFVDHVILFGHDLYGVDTPMPLLEKIRPDVLVKGGQYKVEEVVGYELVTSYGGRIVRAEMEEGFSTTNTITKMAS